MPGVGWCVRSGSARYRIMFTDGVALEVDVDEERVEMVECDGSVVRFGSCSFLVVLMALTDKFCFFSFLLFVDTLYVNAVRAGRSVIV
jgi:hypothetical protein